MKEKSKKKRVRRPWTKEEDDIIRDNYADLGPIITSNLLSHDRDIYSVTKRASMLGVRRNNVKKLRLLLRQLNG